MTWEPQPGPQSSAITAGFVDELFFGGARGGGKSDYLLGDYLQDVRLGSAWRGILFRKTYNELEELQVRAMEIYPKLGAVYKATKSADYPFSNCWYFPGGATLKMRYLEHKNDADGYQGHQYTWIGFDELTNHATPYGYNKLKACLRSAHGVHGRIRASGNPGGKGHIWVKARFIDCAPPYHPFTDKETGLTRVFIPSRLADNAYLRDNKQYISMLKSSGSAELVKAWLEGNWDIVAGAYFDCWDKAKHVINPFAIPKDWTRFRSFDWGSAKPFSVGWWAISDGSLALPKNALVRYREWYGASEPDVGLKLTAEAVADGIAKREKGEAIAYGVADPSCWKVDGGESIAERMRKRNVAFRQADNSRINGWDQVRQRLVGDEAPMIYTFNTCLDSIRTIPLLQHDENNPEDLDSEMEDHCFAAGTLVETLFGQIAIELLPESGSVLSVGGKYEKYRSARLVKKQVDVVRVTFSNGVKVVCTSDHKYLVDTDEWRYAIDLKGMEVLCSRSLLTERFRSLMDYGITFVEDTFREKANGFISLFGHTTTERLSTGNISTTLMLTDQITTYQTLSAFLSKNTCQISMEKQAPKLEEELLRMLSRLRLYGTGVQKVKNGIRIILKKISGRSWMLGLMLFVKNAEKSTRSALQKLSKVNFVGQTVERVRCVSVEKLKEKRDVYCITVPSTGVFAIQSGILVSNCADDWRYACMSRPLIKQAAKRKKPIESGTIDWVFRNSKEEKTVSPYRG